MMPTEHLPEPEPAATLVLIHEDRGQLQVYLIRRSMQSRFMAGIYVFPGGTMERGDYDTQVWSAPPGAEKIRIGKRPGEKLPVATAAAFACAAIRECLEEAGVFLAHTQDQYTQKLLRITCQAQSAERKPDWFRHAVQTDKWRLDIKALHPWSRWITPPQMKYRYDTGFYLAAMPADQICQPDPRETTDGVWIAPVEALKENLEGRLPLSPPTIVTLHQLLSFGRIEELFHAAESRGWERPIMPRWVPLDTGALILEPWDPEYHKPEIVVCRKALESAVLKVGEQFSRIWCNDGLCRPVAATSRRRA